jgi:2'-5' RNA ligase
MYGVVSLLDEQHYREVERVWDEIGRIFGRRGVGRTPFPHFSYHVAERYDSELLDHVLREFARRTPPFTVSTNGLGIFAGLQPVLYVPIVRSSALSEFHRTLWHEISRFGAGIVDYYHPDQWMPHITLAQGDVSPANLPTLVRMLSDHNFTWDIHVDNIALIHNTDDAEAHIRRYPLG